MAHSASYKLVPIQNDIVAPQYFTSVENKLLAALRNRIGTT